MNASTSMGVVTMPAINTERPAAAIPCLYDGDIVCAD